MSERIDGYSFNTVKMGSESLGPCDVSLPPLKLELYTYLGGQIGAVIDFGPSHQIGAVFLRKWAVIYFYISNPQARLVLSPVLSDSKGFSYIYPPCEPDWRCVLSFRLFN